MNDRPYHPYLGDLGDLGDLGEDEQSSLRSQESMDQHGYDYERSRQIQDEYSDRHLHTIHQGSRVALGLTGLLATVLLLLNLCAAL